MHVYLVRLLMAPFLHLSHLLVVRPLAQPTLIAGRWRGALDLSDGAPLAKLTRFAYTQASSNTEEEIPLQTVYTLLYWPKHGRSGLLRSSSSALVSNSDR